MDLVAPPPLDDAVSEELTEVDNAVRRAWVADGTSEILRRTVAEQPLAGDLSL